MSLLFHGIHFPIGIFKPLLNIVAVMVELTQAPGEMQRPGVQLTRVIALYLFDQILHGDPGTLLIRIGKQHREFVTAKANQQIGLAERGLHEGSHRFQCLVALLVAVTIVDLFKTIEIQPSQG